MNKQFSILFLILLSFTLQGQKKDKANPEPKPVIQQPDPLSKLIDTFAVTFKFLDCDTCKAYTIDGFASGIAFTSDKKIWPPKTSWQPLNYFDVRLQPLTNLKSVPYAAVKRE